MKVDAGEVARKYENWEEKEVREERKKKKWGPKLKPLKLVISKF